MLLNGSSNKCFILVGFLTMVQYILSNYDPLVSALIGDGQSNPIANDILKFITTYLFVATTHFLADVLPTLSGLRKLFQKQ